MINKYTEDTYAPRTILPLVMNLVKPKTVVDWGCNRGFWLGEALNLGAEVIHGFDMIGYDEHFRIPERFFSQIDFEKSSPGFPCNLGISLENIEHVSPYQADLLHDEICKSCDVVLFSGATIGQGGTHHVNECHHSYWHSRFALKGFVMYDLIRWCIKDDPDIYPWYKDNIFLYSKIPLPIT
tara:strand:+ start:6348 stop:6893 length:546 start_codon:yes stop_codon:yes gene_type:complete